MLKRLNNAEAMENWSAVPHDDMSLKYHLGEVYSNNRPKDLTNEELNSIAETGVPQGKDTVFGTSAMGIAEGKKREEQAKHDIMSGIFQSILHNGGIQVFRHNETGEFGYQPTEKYDDILRQATRPPKQPTKRSRQFDKPTRAERTDFDQMMAQPGSSMTQQEVEDYWAKQHRDNQVYTESAFGPDTRGEMVETSKYPHAMRPTGPLERVTPTNPTIDVGSIPAPLPAGVEGPSRMRKPDVVRPGEIGPSIPTPKGTLPSGAGIMDMSAPGAFDIEKKRAEAIRIRGRKEAHGMLPASHRLEAAEINRLEDQAKLDTRDVQRTETRQNAIDQAQAAFNANLEQNKIKHEFDPLNPELGHRFYDISEGDNEDSPLIHSISHQQWINRDWGGREAEDVGLSHVDNAGNEFRQKFDPGTATALDEVESVGNYRNAVTSIQKYMQDTHGIHVPVKHMMSWFRENGVLPKLTPARAAERHSYRQLSDHISQNYGVRIPHTNPGAIDAWFKENEGKTLNYIGNNGKVITKVVSKPNIAINRRLNISDTFSSRPEGSAFRWPAMAVQGLYGVIRHLNNSQQDIVAKPEGSRKESLHVTKESTILRVPELKPARDDSGAFLYKPCNNTKGTPGIHSGAPCTVATAAIEGKQKAQVSTDKICPGCGKPREQLKYKTGRMIRQEVRPEGGLSAVKIPRGGQRFDLSSLAEHSKNLTEAHEKEVNENRKKGAVKAAKTRRNRRMASEEVEGAGLINKALGAATDVAESTTAITPPNTDAETEPTKENPQGHAFNRNGNHSKRCSACRVSGSPKADNFEPTEEPKA